METASEETTPPLTEQQFDRMVALLLNGPLLQEGEMKKQAMPPRPGKETKLIVRGW